MARDKMKFKINTPGQATRAVRDEIIAIRKKQVDLRKYDAALHRLQSQNRQLREYELSRSRIGKSRVVSGRLRSEAKSFARRRGERVLSRAVDGARYKRIKSFYKRLIA
jgi:hypothetical protein